MKKTISSLLLLACAGLLAVACCNNGAKKTENAACPIEAASCCAMGDSVKMCCESGCSAGACCCGAECKCANCNHEMKYQSSAFLYESELPWQSPVAGLKRQIMGYNDGLMLVKIDFEAGCDGGGQHSHAHSQTSVVVSGVFEVTIDGVTQTLRKGDGFYAAPNLVHGAICIEAGTLIDAFSPVREDFLK